MSRLALFGHLRGDCLVRLGVCQQKVAENATNSGPQQANAGMRTSVDPTSIKLQAKASPKMNGESRSQRLTGVLRPPSEIPNKTDEQNRRPDSREASLVDKTEFETQADEVNLIRVETEVIDGEPQRDTTIIPSDLLPSSTLDELDLPWITQPWEGDGEARQLIRIPRVLSHDQLEELQRITMTKIIKGECKFL